MNPVKFGLVKLPGTLSFVFVCYYSDFWKDLRKETCLEVVQPPKTCGDLIFPWSQFALNMLCTLKHPWRRKAQLAIPAWTLCKYCSGTCTARDSQGIFSALVLTVQWEIEKKISDLLGPNTGWLDHCGLHREHRRAAGEDVKSPLNSVFMCQMVVSCCIFFFKFYLLR